MRSVKGEEKGSRAQNTNFAEKIIVGSCFYSAQGDGHDESGLNNLIWTKLFAAGKKWGVASLRMKKVAQVWLQKKVESGSFL